ncbi:MAG: transglutaminase domain-containing protein [Kiritimatiellia bacterium]|jgi:transglutaminase-like putative cysteine protease
MPLRTPSRLLLAAAVFLGALWAGWRVGVGSRPGNGGPFFSRHAADSPPPAPQAPGPDVAEANPRRAPSAPAAPPGRHGGGRPKPVPVPPREDASVAPSPSPGDANDPPTATGDAPGEHPLFTLLRENDRRPIPDAVRKLAGEITANETNAAGKAQAIYNWITDNIRYDTGEWLHVVNGGDGYSLDHDPESVLERGTTVCIGYAWLFNELARSAGIDSTYLVGNTRGYRGTPEDEAASGFRHAWNAVKLDDGWALLDATWGARQIDEGDDTYLGRRNYYFNTPADQMIFDHLPESSEWQLLENPVPDRASFESLPNLKPAFFRQGIRLGTPFSESIAVKDGTAAPLIVAAPKGVALAATVTTADGATRRIPVRANDRGVAFVQADGLPSGTNLLRLYAKGANDAAFECAADFELR